MDENRTERALRLVQSVCKDISRVDSKRDQLHEKRDNAIRDALAAGVPVIDLTRATGLNRSRIYQIRDRRR